MGQYATAVLATSGIVSFYDLDDTSGIVAVDSKGVQNGGYSASGVTLNQPGQSGQSAAFTSAASASLTTHPLSGITSVTMECWAYFTDLVTSNQQIMFCGGGGADGYGFYLNGNGTSAGQFYVLFNGVRWANQNFKPGASQWYHLALVIGATSKPNFYVNGVSVATDTGTNPVAPTGGGVIHGSFPGNSDGVAFYNVALSAGTILDHYNAADAYLNGCTMPCRPPTIRALVRGGQTEGLVVACPFGNPVAGQAVNLCTSQAVTTSTTVGGNYGNGRYGINTVFALGTGASVDFTHASVNLLGFTAEVWATFRQWQTASPFISALWRTAGGSQQFRLGDTLVPWDALECPLTTSPVPRLRANTTHQFVLVGSPTAATMYVDGVQVGTTTPFSSTAFTTSSVNKDDASSGTRSTSGEFHMYHLWGRPLSAQEVAQRYADPWGLYEAGGTDVNYLFTGLTYPPVGPALVVSL